MKKLTAGLLSALLALSLTACGADTTKATDTTITNAPVSTSAATTTDVETTTTDVESTTTEPETTTTEPTTTTQVTTTTTTEPATTTTEEPTTTTQEPTTTTTTTQKVTTTSMKKPATTPKVTTTTTKKPTTTKVTTITTKKPTTTITKQPTTTTKATTTTKKPTTATTTVADLWDDGITIYGPCDSCDERISDRDPSCPHCGVAYYQCSRCGRYTHSVEDDHGIGLCLCGHCGMDFYHCSGCGRNVEETLEICPHCDKDNFITCVNCGERTAPYLVDCAHCGRNPERPIIPLDPEMHKFSEKEQKLMDLINETRAAEGLPALKTNNILRQAAEIRVYDLMEQGLDQEASHNHFVLTDMGLDALHASANLYAYMCGAPAGICDCSVSAEEILESWMTKHEGNRENILSPKAEEVAVAIVEGEGYALAAVWFYTEFSWEKLDFFIDQGWVDYAE